MHRARLVALITLAAPLAAQVPIRVGLDTQSVEWQVSLEGGGQVCRRDGRPLFALRQGEKLRIWWDARGETDTAQEYRVQVGAAVTLPLAEAQMSKLRTLGEAPDRERVADGNTWRILTGRFKTAEEAEPLLEKLQASGWQELWVSLEKRPGRPAKGRALYAVTERYERRPLPLEGVSFKPAGGLTQVHGKGKYRGRMEIFPNLQGRLTIVNTVPLEGYLRGVVPRELGPGEYPALEALKAQAVAARTYAYANRGKRDKEGFDLLDTVADQVYGGVEGEHALTDRAIQETEGLIATFQGRPIQALFMANGGGATIDNTFVFGGDQGYLKGATSYAERPLALTFKGREVAPDSQTWLGWDLVRLAAWGVLAPEHLNATWMQASLAAEDLTLPLERLAQRLQLSPSTPLQGQGPSLLLAMARTLGLGDVPNGQERIQDADYFLQEVKVPEADRLLAAFLTRRGLVPSALWKPDGLTRLQGLQVLARLWQELENLELLEGRLLQDGQVQIKGKAPQALRLTAAPLLVEEAPGGFLRLLSETRVQVGDKVRWLAAEGGSPLLVRRLDPDGASWDRYNPTAHWRQEVKEAELLVRLKSRAGFQSVGAIQVEHNDQGRATRLVITDQKGRSHAFTGMRIRQILGLKDNVFRFVEVGRKPDRRWICFGRGWGHGVGMDQTGAFGMALEGATFQQILHHYYTGIELTKL